jgi:hypothetical protein
VKHLSSLFEVNLISQYESGVGERDKVVDWREVISEDKIKIRNRNH